MNKTTCFISACFFLFIESSCEDIFIKDISKDHVNIVAPIRHSVIKNGKVTCVWEVLEHVDDYHVVIVSPSFDAIQIYVCDSVVKDPKLTLPLSPGDYEWSVQARNYGYVSERTITTFKVELP